MMDFSTLKELTIPEGVVTKISSGNTVLWQKVVEDAFTSTYQEVEYIQAGDNVGAYLDLGFAFDTGAIIELAQYMTTNTTAYPFGCAENSGKLRCMFTAPNYHATNYICYPYGSTGSAYISADGTYKMNAWNYFTLTFKKGNLGFYNSTTGFTGTKATQGEYTMSNNLYLFAQNYNGAARFGGLRRIGSFKYYDKTNTLICDLVPCYRKSDGVIGMYDRVRKIFLTNVGTGAFTKGANVA